MAGKRLENYLKFLKMEGDGLILIEMAEND